jgi:hypothetical protein
MSPQVARHDRYCAETYCRLSGNCGHRAIRSLRGRLTVLLVLLVAAALAAGALMFGLFRQSATAQAGQAEAEIGRACDAISNAFRFYGAGWNGPATGADDDALRRDLTAVVRTALRDRPALGQKIEAVGNRSISIRRSLVGRRAVVGNMQQRIADPAIFVLGSCELHSQNQAQL